jgi:hypothetical protein
MHIRDRITELRRVRAGDLVPNPRNWRTHPAAQQDALRGVLAEIGYACALLARELGDGSLQLIDGHLRAETTPDAQVPVLILDVTAAEADKLLLTIDPLSAMAERDDLRLAELLATVKTDNAAVQSLLDGLTTAELPPELESNNDRPEIDIPESYQVIVECHDESQQQEVFERLTREGYKCRLAML